MPDAAAVAAVSCRGLTKNYGRGEASVAALRGVDLDVARGEVVMLMGPSGCGKTTLLSIIAALLDADAGRCAIGGTDTAGMTRTARATLRAAKLGFVFQAFNLLPALTARENASVPLLLAGVARRAAEAAAENALAEVGLADRRDYFPRQLSGGQQQRVAIARAIVHPPDLLLCDEPTSALDHDAGHQVMAVLTSRVRSLGAALLVVTHDPRIAPFADRVIRMEDGAIVADDGRVAA
ncbi:ABC transporter ATP-binding protein [Sphingomonas oligophenolica]|uniref:ABC transporter ATP-binding protein n=1 Tax=Sphingomonas oligophenolica TaxID=301154 RepID=A0A502CII1_9SPHN|nr:ABC transporter ATP-binding protein [Sphingomonas oligophenolica]TPG12768.1 ABC transporter ATP-binding protein [Sphingomonas oligophenolica]